jgi:hypothetical protein
VAIVSDARDSRVLFGVAGLILTGWLCFLAWRIGIDTGAVRQLLAETSKPPPLSAWTSVDLVVGPAIWLVPVAGAMGVVVFSGNGWGLRSRVAMLCTLAVATWALFMLLNVGLYSPVERVMDKFL